MTTDGPLDERYLEWLYSLIAPVRNRNPARSHWILVAQLHQKEFSWFVPNDYNRIADGLELREEFIEATNAERNQMWLELECSMLEMLIALCRRMEFESSHNTYYWFWCLMDNLSLLEYVDEIYDDTLRLTVNDVLDTVIERVYSQDGTGGLFPLQKTDNDQRSVELWYQMSSYLLEKEYS